MFDKHIYFFHVLYLCSKDRYLNLDHFYHSRSVFCNIGLSGPDWSFRSVRIDEQRKQNTKSVFDLSARF